MKIKRKKTQYRVVYRCVRCGQPRRTVVSDLDSNKWTDVYCLPCVEEMKEKDDESDS